jgi:hypothetical protein
VAVLPLAIDSTSTVTRQKPATSSEAEGGTTARGELKQRWTKLREEVHASEWTRCTGTEIVGLGPLAVLAVSLVAVALKRPHYFARDIASSRDKFGRIVITVP